MKLRLERILIPPCRSWLRYRYFTFISGQKHQNTISMHYDEVDGQPSFGDVSYF